MYMMREEKRLKKEIKELKDEIVQLTQQRVAYSQMNASDVMKEFALWNVDWELENDIQALDTAMEKLRQIELRRNYKNEYLRILDRIDIEEIISRDGRIIGIRL